MTNREQLEQDLQECIRTEDGKIQNGAPVPLSPEMARMLADHLLKCGWVQQGDIRARREYHLEAIGWDGATPTPNKTKRNSVKIPENLPHRHQGRVRRAARLAKRPVFDSLRERVDRE